MPCCQLNMHVCAKNKHHTCMYEPPNCAVLSADFFSDPSCLHRKQMTIDFFALGIYCTKTLIFSEGHWAVLSFHTLLHQISQYPPKHLHLSRFSIHSAVCCPVPTCPRYRGVEVARWIVAAPLRTSDQATMSFMVSLWQYQDTGDLEAPRTGGGVATLEPDLELPHGMAQCVAKPSKFARLALHRRTGWRDISAGSSVAT